MQTKNNITLSDQCIARCIVPFLPAWVTPNQITGFRFAATPLVLYFLAVGEYGWGLIAFAAVAFTDAIDGALARTRGPITDWGKMYDPLADKLLIGSVAALMVSRFAGHGLALSIILLELFILAGALWRRKYRGLEIQARSVGKAKMILQSVGVGLVLLYALIPFAPLLFAARLILYAAISFAILSLLVYRSI